MPQKESGNPKESGDFVRTTIEEHNKSGRFGGHVITRFPPEPNGFLHIGHAKAICLNFGVAHEYGGRCHLRFDDTNPVKEEAQYVDAIRDDITWLGYSWGDHEYFASDYFATLHEYAVQLIKDGLAYVDDLSAEEIREYRGTLTEPGKDSPHRNRTVAENIELFDRMRRGDFAEGERVLRAKIDMASPNLNLRDPVMYRIIHSAHHRTGNKWCVYPTYDWAHGQSDAIEGITHSLCDLSFEDHRPLYDWYLDKLSIHHPQQIEFARLNITYTVLSKRVLRRLVEAGHVSGWDDPRMPTLRGLRRRGYTPASIRAFIDRVGVAKSHSTVDIALLEYFIREELNATAPRVMAVLDPVKVVIDNYPEGKTELLEAENNPEDPAAGSRELPFGREIFIEREDFREDPPRKYFRLAPGREIRLKHAYYITCVGFEKDDETGMVKEIHCTYDPNTRGGWSEDGRKVRGTSHWVSCEHAATAEVRIFDRLFAAENPEELEEGEDVTNKLNPSSLEVRTDCKVEPSLLSATPGSRYQFLRKGYFCVDTRDSSQDRPVFNRIVGLRDTWAKISRKTKN